MSNLKRKFYPSSIIITLTATIMTVAQPQPASAQLLEVAAGALNALIGSKNPQPQVIQQPVPVPVPMQPSRPEFSVGTNNANGNNFHFCLSNCLPSASNPAPTPTVIPQQTFPTPMPTPMVVPQQGVTAPIAQQQNNSSVTSGTIVNPNSSLPGMATSQTTQQSSSQSATVQN